MLTRIISPNSNQAIEVSELCLIDLHGQALIAPRVLSVLSSPQRLFAPSVIVSAKILETGRGGVPGKGVALVR